MNIMNFCCDKFKKDYQLFNTSSEHEIMISELNKYDIEKSNLNIKNNGSVTKTKIFFQRIWNVKYNKYIDIIIKYCPYCGECLSAFYTDDAYINVVLKDSEQSEIDDKENSIYIQANGANNSFLGKIKTYYKNRNIKKRRDNELDMCCDVLENFYDQPKWLSPIRFVIAKSVLDKSITDFYTIEKDNKKINIKKIIRELSFRLVSRDKYKISLSSKDEKYIDWNFCPFCGKNLYEYYNNSKYCNEIEGRDFAFLEPENTMIVQGGLSKKC